MLCHVHWLQQWHKQAVNKESRSRRRTFALELFSMKLLDIRHIQELIWSCLIQHADKQSPLIIAWMFLETWAKKGRELTLLIFPFPCSYSKFLWRFLHFLVLNLLWCNCPFGRTEKRWFCYFKNWLLVSWGQHKTKKKTNIKGEREQGSKRAAESFSHSISSTFAAKERKK